MHKSNQNQKKTTQAFNTQAGKFDAIYDSDIIVEYKRHRVRSHLEKFISHGSKILELNAGTGNDAIYFAQQGHWVHATDIAENMQQILIQKVARAQLQNR
ncbi:MAG: class I SAM-dependent methyltransferase, partial [Chitinophagales bacterium]